MSSSRKSRLPPVVTIIGHDADVAGALSFTDGLHVDGVVQGDVIAKEGRASALTVSHNGRVEGNVQAQNLRLDGKITGNVYVTGRVELGTDAMIQGDVSYGFLEMAMGAEVNGVLSRITVSEKE